jgi:hypothetical protein
MNSLSKTTVVKNAFEWRGPSQTLDKYGRMKTLRQIALDGTRVNPESNLGYSTTPTKSERAPR